MREWEFVIPTVVSNAVVYWLLLISLGYAVGAAVGQLAKLPTH
jgi:hypothetical protein